MNILIANVGSTSFKYKLYAMEHEVVLAEGNIQRVGQSNATIVHKVPGQSNIEKTLDIPDYAIAIQRAMDLLVTSGVVRSFSEINAVGFKTVHARGITDSVLIDDGVIKAMTDYIPLVPAHNPPYLQAISIFQKQMPALPLVGVFESGFHRTMPEYARIYGTPYTWYQQQGIRKYGFHGASHRYIAQRVPQILNKNPEDLNIISCHLGGSASVCAIQRGASIDTTMGFTSQEGLLNATRVGDLDPFIVLYMQEQEGLSTQEIRQALTEEGGLQGISGVSGDIRDLHDAAAEGNQRAKLAIDAFVYGIKKYIGAYMAILGGADVLAFTGGIGQNDDIIRGLVCDTGLEYLGIEIDAEENKIIGEEKILSSVTSKVKIISVPANEELIVARETARVLKREGVV